MSKPSTEIQLPPKLDELAKRYSHLELSCDESVRIHDVVQRAFRSGYLSAAAELRAEAIRRNEPDPTYTGIEWANWLEQGI